MYVARLYQNVMISQIDEPLLWQRFNKIERAHGTCLWNFSLISFV